MSAVKAGKEAGRVEEEAPELCRSLTDHTRRMLDSASGGDIDSFGEALAGRQKVLDSMSALRAARPDAFTGCGPLLREAAALDARTNRAFSAMLVQKREELRRANRSFGPLMRYADSRFGLAAGMILDRVE